MTRARSARIAMARPLAIALLLGASVVEQACDAMTVGTPAPSPDSATTDVDAANASMDVVSSEDSSDDLGEKDATAACTTNQDCPQGAFAGICVQCVDGGVSCASAQCVAGSCQGIPPPVCVFGSHDNPCAQKGCGDPCVQCNTQDGVCYPGSCNYLDACKAAPSTCPSPTNPNPGYGCAAFDAVGVGDCNHLLGFAWDGLECVPVVGCVCRGSDCPDLITRSGDCAFTFEVCPQDAAGGG
jgi:hypothetical protein